MAKIDRTVPVEEEVRPDGERIYRHPAFASISLGRVSGTTYLNGSDYPHQHYFALKIHRSERHRTLSNDWHFPREELIEVAFTEAQWMAFVSSAGMHVGAPCTLQRLRGELVPEIPKPAKQSDAFRAEARQRFEKVRDSLAELAGLLAESGLSNVKRSAMMGKLTTALQNLDANAGFVMDQFGEHMEAIVEDAKATVHGHLAGLAMSAGLPSIAGVQARELPAVNAVLSIENGDTE